MDIYLPIAGLSVNALVIVGLGMLVGILSGMFGVGGGFLTTPLLIFYGIPPAVAVGSSATQVAGTSVSGAIAHSRRGGVDYQMGGTMAAGGAIGSLIGGVIFRLLQKSGQIDTAVGLLYVFFLGGIGLLMLREAVGTLVRQRSPGAAPAAAPRRHHPLIAMLPLRWRFYRSGLYISPLAPLVVGIGIGILTVLLGVGGGFIVVPAMIYLLGMSTRVVIGTSLFQTLFTAAAATMIHATSTKAVDIVLAVLLLVGSVTGAQIGARFASKLKPEWLRLILALIVLTVALRMALGLGWRPGEIYTVQPL
ncbi:MAG TPA: sulfite exporter TauE/SafE family protein [Sphingomonadaceae bacterium]|jgi:uncharacterized membrane protein YfcA|nr:sulfite exporter TauE/SafE family protein [Sphingomonadaceae bacterium]